VPKKERRRKRIIIIIIIRNGAKTISLPNVVGRLNKGSNTGKRARRENFVH
jgi:hypothetical protein